MESFESFSSLLHEWIEAQSIPQSLQRRLYEKIRGSVFDAGDSFSLVVTECDDNNDDNNDDDNDNNNEEEEKVEVEDSPETPHRDEAPGENEQVDSEDPAEGANSFLLATTRDLRAHEDIWLVDHCCTFRMREFRQNLEADEALRERLARMLGLRLSHSDARLDTQVIFDNMWHLVGSYRLPASQTAAGDAQYDSYWFIHDEVGSAIAATSKVDRANVKLEPIPLYFSHLSGVVSAMWCVKDIAAEEVVTHAPVSLVGTLRPSRGDSIAAWLQQTERLGAIQTQSSRPNGTAGQKGAAVRGGGDTAVGGGGGGAPPATESPLRVFTDSRLVVEFLTDSAHFTVVELPEDADIVWVAHDAIDEDEDVVYTRARFISQFPEERLFTSKLGLLHLVQNTIGYADWYQVSYDATAQLMAFVGDYTVRQARLDGREEEHMDHLRNEDGTNLWITKPANMARSIDMTVTANLDQLLKTIETGPKVVCKYIANTATLRRRKFDLRFIVAVRSFTSTESVLEAYVYNVFWTRFALDDYALNEFDRYEKHWTVMNYSNADKLLQLHYDAFIPELNQEYAAKGYGSSVWENIAYPKILTMLRDALSIVHLRENRTRCRAIYGMDVMLRETVSEETGVKTLEPSLLEITYSPDCKRACKYHPSFFNDVFNTLFLGSPANMTRL